MQRSVASDNFPYVMRKDLRRSQVATPLKGRVMSSTRVISGLRDSLKTVLPERDRALSQAIGDAHVTC